MTCDEFWTIVDRVHAAAGWDRERKCELLGQELRALSAAEMRSFDEHYRALYYQAYTEDLWGAAYVIRHGCGDDSFMDFRSTLIFMGRDIVEKAFRDPESLAELNLNRETAASQAYSIAMRDAFDDVMKREGISQEEIDSWPAPPHPQTPTGVPFKESALTSRYPKLATKHGFKDEAGPEEKSVFEYTIRSGNEVKQFKGSLADFLLDSGIIHPSGWIPPFSVVVRVTLEGRFDSGSRSASWNPFWIQRTDYIAFANLLEQAPQLFLAQRPALQKIRFQWDQSQPATDYAKWVQSLKERGLL
jgi:hypothetical protein